MGSQTEQAKRMCFVVCPIGPEGSPIRVHADRVLHHIIEPPCSDTGFVLRRADQVEESGLITRRVIEDLLRADLVVADLSGANPNVFYELGVRHFTGLPVIHLQQKTEHLPFDIADCRCILYDLTNPDSVEAARSRMAGFIQAIDSQRCTPNPVSEVLHSYAFPLPLSLGQRVDPIKLFERLSSDLLIELQGVRQERDGFLDKLMEMAERAKVPGVSASGLPDYSGLWDHDDGMVKLIQTGDRIYGDYQWGSREWVGTLSGKVLDKCLMARWKQGSMEGIIRWVPDGQDKLNGHWWHQYDAYRLDEMLRDPQLYLKLPFPEENKWNLVRA